MGILKIDHEKNRVVDVRESADRNIDKYCVGWLGTEV
jgi:hypothetical protein